MEIELHFFDLPEPTLTKVVVRHHGEERISVRGKSEDGSGFATGSFQWTSAVRGFSILALRTKQGLNGLEGMSGSPAASLDDALSKPPRWLVELFGSQLGRVFKRLHPRRRTGEAVTILLNPTILPSEHVSIFYSGARLGSSQLEMLRHDLEMEERWEGDTAIPDLLNDKGKLSELYREMLTEFTNTTRLTDIFTTHGWNTATSRLLNDRSFCALLPDTNSFLQAIAPSGTPRELLGYGCVSRSLRDTFDAPLSIVTSLSSLSAVAVIETGARELGVPINLDCSYAYGVELCELMLQGKVNPMPDLCILGIAPGASLYRERAKLGYEPLTLLPAMSHRVLTKGKCTAQKLRSGRYLLINSSPSTSAFYLRGLKESGLVDGNKAICEHATPSEMTQALANDSDVRAISHFPFTATTEIFAGFNTHQPLSGDAEYKDCVLFAHRRVLEKAGTQAAILQMVRSGWLSLRERGEVRKQAVKRWIEHPAFLTALSRFSGLSALR